MRHCAALSRKIGQDIARELELPVYLYERSAAPGRPFTLPQIRRGGFEGLFTEPLTGLRRPDFGPSEPHATAGICVVGARDPLIAYNVDLQGSGVPAARAVAASIRRERAYRPDLSGARALGLWLPSRDVAQVSMNLTRPDATTLPAVFDFVRQEAARHGAEAAMSEVIGLAPRAALAGEPAERILWRTFRETQILEYWIG
jgi:glutamate formiminotransferase